MPKKKNTIEFPEIAAEIVGTCKTFSGHVFSYRNKIEETAFQVLDWRWGHTFIFDIKKWERKHPTVEFLLKNESMKRARWSRGFPARDYVADGEDGWKRITSEGNDSTIKPFNSSQQGP